MDFSAHIAALVVFLPCIVAVPAAIAIICNRITATKQRPEVVYTFCGLLALGSALLLSRFVADFYKVDLLMAGALAVLCFVIAYLQATNILTKEFLALLWRELFLLGFAALCLCFVSGDWKSSGYGLLGSLCIASAVLLWRSSPLARYPLYAATLYLAGGALLGGIYSYLHDPALLQKPIQLQIISWLIPGIPSVLLIYCCLYARQIGRD